MSFLAFVAALVLFIVAAVCAFMVSSVTITDLIGIVSVGLAALTVALMPLPSRVP